MPTHVGCWNRYNLSLVLHPRLKLSDINHLIFPQLAGCDTWYIHWALI